MISERTLFVVYQTTSQILVLIFNVDNSAMSDIRIKDIGKDIGLTPIEFVMRDDKLDNTSEANFNIIVNIHPTEGTHWVLGIRRKDGPVYYFDSLVLR